MRHGRRIRLAERVAAALPLSSIEGSEETARVAETRMRRGLTGDRRLRRALLWVAVSAGVHATLLWSGSLEANDDRRAAEREDDALFVMQRYLVPVPGMEDDVDEDDVVAPRTRSYVDESLWQPAEELDAGYPFFDDSREPRHGDPSVIGSQAHSLGLAIGDVQWRGLLPPSVALAVPVWSIGTRPLTIEQITVSLADQWHDVQACVEVEARGDMRRAGFTIERDGAVSGLDVPDGIDEACITRLLRSVRYPAPPAERFRVSWPLPNLPQP